MPIEALTRACADADSRAVRLHPHQLHTSSHSDVAYVSAQWGGVLRHTYRAGRIPLRYAGKRR
jgi:hypothetical protein